MQSRLLMPSIITILIGSATLLDQTMLLVVLLALLTPLWRLILAVFLFFVTLFLRLMNSPAIMLRRAVNSHELQRLRLRRVDELVLSSGWDDDDVGSFDVLQQAIVND
jgi:hypothetical protein